jgi:hypothetical protein
MAHFPNQVQTGGVTISLRDWATGRHMSELIKALVDLSLTSLAEGKVTGVVRAASAVKTVSPGLSPEHSPF